MAKLHSAKVQGSGGGSGTTSSTAGTLGELTNVNDAADAPNDAQVLTWDSGAFSAVATDSFNRADQALGGTTTETGNYTYIAFAGTPSISGNQFKNTAGIVQWLQIDLGLTDQAIQSGSTTAVAGNIQWDFRHVDTNNRLGTWWDGLTLTLYKVVGGVVTLGLATYVAAARGAVRTEVAGDAVTVYLDGILRLSYTITDAVLRTGTKIGLVAAEINDFHDDFVAYSLLGEWVASTPITARDGRPGLDGEDADFLQIPGAPGQPGSPGSAGATGPAGLSIPGQPGEDADDILIPGPPGNPGGTGTTGATGRDGLSIPGLPGDDADDPLVVPGLRGADGVSGSGTTTAFTKDLGVCYRSGTFDVTGLSGLTADRSYDVRMSAAAITTKGNARDESEMDTIVLTAYALNTTDLRVYWYADSVMVGTYAFVSVT